MNFRKAASGVDDPYRNVAWGGKPELANPRDGVVDDGNIA
jgi:hypothetical protein